MGKGFTGMGRFDSSHHKVVWLSFYSVILPSGRQGRSPQFNDLIENSLLEIVGNEEEKSTTDAAGKKHKDPLGGKELGKGEKMRREEGGNILGRKRRTRM